MRIDRDKCVECGLCLNYCPVEAIVEGVDGVFIDREACVECGVCLKSGVCAQGALYQPPLEWPRALRAQFSDPLVSHPATGIKGRGTAEMKTNDVSGRFREGEVGFAIELGRPGVSTSFADVERVAKALVDKVEFEPLNPVTTLLDLEKGVFKDVRVRGERALSAIIECKAVEDEALDVLETLKEVAGELDTVFSLCVISKCVGYEVPFRERMVDAGYEPRINGKTNVGLGRPLA